jgi:hypothetical protein
VTRDLASMLFLASSVSNDKFGAIDREDQRGQAIARGDDHSQRHCHAGIVMNRANLTEV